ncbi:MAG: NAD(P)-dependent oxidoreductase [Magnetococcales bacterium]|nr:NAD(P)-dependent oxidoreductase [Magnetococcales bacterium]
MKVAVTGPHGFIGRHVVAELEGSGVSPVLVVRPAPENVRRSGSRHPVVPMDLANPPRDAYDALGRPDVVIHLAWSGLPDYGSLHHFEVELPLHYRFLRTLVTGGLPHLVVSGTCFEYGLLHGPLEEHRETQPGNPYGFAKDGLRRQLEYLRGTHPFNLTWARLFYLYGEGQGPNALWSQLKKAVERGERVFNMSGGEQLRDYLPVSVAAGHLVTLALRERDHGVVNVCSGTPISVRVLVETWLREHGWSIDLNRGHYPYPDYEPMAFWGVREKLDRCVAPS